MGSAAEARPCSAATMPPGSSKPASGCSALASTRSERTLPSMTPARPRRQACGERRVRQRQDLSPARTSLSLRIHHSQYRPSFHMGIPFVRCPPQSSIPMDTGCRRINTGTQLTLLQAGNPVMSQEHKHERRHTSRFRRRASDMYGLPHDVDLGFFIGKELSSVHFARHSLILHFDGDVSVTVTSSIGWASPDGAIQRHDDFRQVAPQVLGLLNQPVTSATAVDAGTLSLQFADGSRLYVYDDSKEYESYTIKNGDQMIVV